MSINPRDHPSYFSNMSPERRAKMPALTGLFTPKNPNEVIIRDNFGSGSGIALTIKFSKCKQENLPIGEECASQKEL